MKKKVLAILLCGCIAASALSGCGEDPEVTIDNGTVNIEETPGESKNDPPAEDDSSEETTEETKEDPAEATEDETKEENEAAPASDWFTEHGLTITPQGDFTYNTFAVDAFWEDLELFPVKSTVTVTETTEGVEEGYKIVTATWHDDVSAGYDVAGSNGGMYWKSAFDRYTGISFEFDSSTNYTNQGEGYTKEGFITIVHGDESYDVSVAFGSEDNYPYYTRTVAVTCPVDYDGAVFYIGPWSSAKAEENNQIDYLERLYTIDELPAYGDGYYFFSYSNK